MASTQALSDEYFGAQRTTEPADHDTTTATPVHQESTYHIGRMILESSLSVLGPASPFDFNIGRFDPRVLETNGLACPFAKSSPERYQSSIYCRPDTGWRSVPLVIQHVHRHHGPDWRERVHPRELLEEVPEIMTAEQTTLVETRVNQHGNNVGTLGDLYAMCGKPIPETYHVRPLLGLLPSRYDGEKPWAPIAPRTKSDLRFPAQTRYNTSLDSFEPSLNATDELAGNEWLVGPDRVGDVDSGYGGSKDSESSFSLQYSGESGDRFLRENPGDSQILSSTQTKADQEQKYVSSPFIPLYGGYDQNGDADAASVSSHLAGSHLDVMTSSPEAWGRYTHNDVSATIEAKQLVCPYCKVTVKTKSELRKHEQKHTKTHHCHVPTCTRVEGFSTQNDVDRHVRVCHPEVITKNVYYNCTIANCRAKDKKWPRADNFRQHLRRVHQIQLTDEDSLKSFEATPPIPDNPGQASYNNTAHTGSFDPFEGFSVIDSTIFEAPWTLPEAFAPGGRSMRKSSKESVRITDAMSDPEESRSGNEDEADRQQGRDKAENDSLLPTRHRPVVGDGTHMSNSNSRPTASNASDGSSGPTSQGNQQLQEEHQAPGPVWDEARIQGMPTEQVYESSPALLQSSKGKSPIQNLPAEMLPEVELIGMESQSEPINITGFAARHGFINNWEQNSHYERGFDPEDLNSVSDNMSLSSGDSSSIFDTISTRSTNSSILGDTQLLVSNFVYLIVQDPDVHVMLSRIFSETGRDLGTFRRHFSRILQSYSKGLKQDLQVDSIKNLDPSYNKAIAFVSKKTLLMKAANLIVEKYTSMEQMQDHASMSDHLLRKYLDQQQIPPLQTPPPLSDSDSPSEGESDEDKPSFNIDELKSFFVSGEPFRSLKWKLRGLIIADSYLTLVKKSTDQLLDVASRGGLKNLLSKAYCGTLAKGCSDDFSVVITGHITKLATDLHKQCIQPGQLHMAAMADFLLIYSQYISERLKETYSPENASRIESRQHSANVLEDIVAAKLPKLYTAEFAAHWNSLTSTKPFSDFYNALKDLAFPTFFSQAKKWVMGMPDDPQRRLLLPVLDELQQAIERDEKRLKSTVRIYPRHDSIVDQFKLAVESSTDSHWDWWPLQPPPRRQPDTDYQVGYVLSWNCACGIQRRETVSPLFGRKLLALLDAFPLSIPLQELSPSTASGSLSRRGSSQDQNGSSASSSGDDCSVNGHSPSGSTGSTNTGVTTPDGSGSFVVGVDSDSHARFVFLLIRKSHRYHLEQIEVTKMNSQEFFKALKHAYHKHRGLLRRFCSIFIYNHCDFVEVERWSSNRYQPGTTFSFPPTVNDEYSYAPDPMPPPGIHPHQFYELFYTCHDTGSLTHVLHNMISKCNALRNLSNLRARLPKRNSQISGAAEFGEDDDSEIFWGLVAREQRSAARVIGYMVLSLLPSLVFAFEWLFGWKHFGDLQNATVPLTFTFTFWGIIWAVVYSESTG